MLLISPIPVVIMSDYPSTLPALNPTRSKPIVSRSPKNRVAFEEELVSIPDKPCSDCND